MHVSKKTICGNFYDGDHTLFGESMTGAVPREDMQSDLMIFFGLDLIERYRAVVRDLGLGKCSPDTKASAWSRCTWCTWLGIVACGGAPNENYHSGKRR